MKLVLTVSVFLIGLSAFGQTLAPSPTPITTPTPNPTPIATAEPTPSPPPVPTPTPVPTKTQVTIKQVDLEKNRVAAEVTGDSSAIFSGSQFIALQDGKNCFFSVTSVSGKILQLDIFKCPFQENLKVGMTLEPSLFNDPRPNPEPDWLSPAKKYKYENGRDDRIRVAVSPYFGVGNTLDSDNICYTANGQSAVWGGGSITMNSAPGVALEIYHSPQYGFGWAGGASYDFQRNVSGLSAWANGNYIGGPFSNPEPTLSILATYANAIYRLEDFYFPFGINFAIPSLQGGGNSFGNTTLYSGVGLQLGAGYILEDNISLEFIIQNFYFSGNTTTPSAYINYNGLSFTNPEIRLRLSF